MVMPFLNIVEKVIDLSQKCEADDNRIARKHGLELGVNLGKHIKKVAEFLHEPRPAEDQLKKYLEGLQTSDVMKLQTLMYAGRDQEDIPELHLHLKDNAVDKNDTMRTMMGKGSDLPLYLAEGLKEAASQRVDIDRPF
jgi:hypothetical protein